MNPFTIKKKCAFAWGVLALIVMLLTVMVILALSDAHQQLRSYVSGTHARSETVHRMRESADLRAIAVRNLLLLTQPEELAEEKTLVLKAHADVTAQLTRLKHLASASGAPADAKRLIEQLDRIERAYAPVVLAIVDLTLQGKHGAAVDKMRHESKPLLASLVKVTRDYERLTSILAAQEIAMADKQYASHLRWLVGGCLLAVAATVMTGMLAARCMARSTAPSHLVHAWS